LRSPAQTGYCSTHDDLFCPEGAVLNAENVEAGRKEYERLRGAA